VVLVLVRQMRTRKVGPLDDTLSQRELPHSMHTGTLQLHALQHMSAVPFELLSSFNTTIEDVCSQSQI
jgi:hypothetical protein